MSFTENLKEKMGDYWEYGFQHSFLQELGKGTLEMETFQFYLIQDYYYLLEYAKVFALGVTKSKKEDLLYKFSDVLYNTLHTEIQLHREYMRNFGITESQLEEHEIALFNKAYTSNMLSVAQSGGIAEILATAFPCAWTYGDYGKRLKEMYQDTLDSNPYKSWIEMYASKEFEQSYQWFFKALDEAMQYKSKEKVLHIENIFADSLAFENLFWDMSYKKLVSY
ncbi:MAG: thiaminase II [Coprobacillaceae bacterium]